MAACKPVTFQNISRDRFQAVRARIRAQADVAVMGDMGTASGNGFTATWNYDEPSQVLTIQCTVKPWFISEGLVADKIRALVTTL
jgi:hypothetical protein